MNTIWNKNNAKSGSDFFSIIFHFQRAELQLK